MSGASIERLRAPLFFNFASVINSMKKVTYNSGDIVMDSRNSTWGKQRFEVYAQFGSAYCPMLACYLINDDKVRKQVNIVMRTARIVDSNHRPYRNIPTKVLIKMRAKGKAEAVKEFEIRKNTKTL